MSVDLRFFLPRNPTATKAKPVRTSVDGSGAVPDTNVSFEDFSNSSGSCALCQNATLPDQLLPNAGIGLAGDW